MTNMAQRIEISYKTILFVVFLLLSIWIIYLVRDVIYLLVVSFLIMSGLRPFIDKLEKLKIPRILAILIVYFILFGLISWIVYLIIPPLMTQLQQLLKALSSYLSVALPFFNISTQSLTDQIPSISSNVFKLTTGLVSRIVGFFTLIIFTFYLLLERKHLRNFLINFLGREAEEKVVNIVGKIEHQLGAWVIGQFTLMLIIGIATYIGLILLGMNFALSLAIIAGLLEIIPILGPILSGVPAVLVALSVSPVLAIAVVALYFIIQQIEGNVVVPMVMRRAVGLPPLVTILALMIGGKLAGIGGMILSVPFLVAFQVIVRDFLYPYIIKPQKSV